MSKENKSNGGVSFLGMLTILFIGLKLTGFINWSWWLVLLPTLGSFAIVLILFLVILLVKALDD